MKKRIIVLDKGIAENRILEMACCTGAQAKIK